MDLHQNHNVIQLLNWNSCTLNGKQPELVNFIKLNNINLATITETRLKPKLNFNISGFKTYRKDRLCNTGGGVATLIQSNMSHSDVPDLDLQIIESKALDIQTNLGLIRHVSIYMPHNCETTQDCQFFEQDLMKLANFRGMFILSGDLNAKHKDWNNLMTNKNGRILKGLIEDGIFTILSPDNPTRFSNIGTPATIDIILSNIQEHFFDSKTVFELSSDHFPTISSLNCSSIPAQETFRFNYNKADWPKFKNSIQNALNLSIPLSSENDIEDALNHFTSVLKDAETCSVRKITKKRNLDLDLDPVTKHLIGHKNAKRREYIRTGNPVLHNQICQLKKLINDRIFHLRNQNFSNELQRMPDRSNPFWKITKILKSKPLPMPPFKEVDKVLLTNPEKCEALANHFLNSHKINLNTASPMDTPAQSTFDSLKLSPSFIPDGQKISHGEIKQIVKRFKNFKAPGIDAIMSITIKRLPSVAFEFLANVFNRCLEICYFPNCWKIAKVIPLLKAGKDPTLSSSYRPISLLSCVSKIFEKLILTRLETHIFDNNIYMEEQFGFRSGHSTAHQLQRVLNHIKSAKQHRKTTIMALLDIEKAFDSVWHTGLILKLHNFGFPLYLLKTLISYLSEREFKVFLYGTFSEPRNIPAGVPQGSVLGPVLYNLFTSDFPEAPPSCQRAMYADDTALMATGIGTRNTIPKLQKYINTCTQYYKNWKITPNSAKTEVIRFNGSVKKRKLDLFKKIKVNGSEIPWSNEVKYLGLTIDKNLTFYSHSIKMLSKVKTARFLLYPLINRKSKLSPTNKLAVYCQIIRPIMTYAAPVWKDISAQRKKDFQVFQNKTLKMCLGLHPRTSTILLHDRTKIPTLTEFIQKLFDNFKSGAASSEYRPIRELFND